MWDKLMSVYEQKSETSVHMLLQQWYNLQKSSSDDIITNVARLEDLAHRLQNLGEKIPDQMIITKILMTMPPSYKHFISAWESTQADERTLINVVARLTIEEARMGQSEKSESAAFTAAGKQSNKKTGKKPEKTGTCHYCHKPGHWIRDCRKRKTAIAKQTSDKGEALIGQALYTIRDDETVNGE